MKKLFILLKILFFLLNLSIWADENIYKIMYVNAKGGLRKRTEPSLNGNIAGVLSNGQRLIIYTDNAIEDTIDGINDYWYRIRFDDNGFNANKDWVFGGYLSENLPSDVPIVLGRWDNIEWQREHFNINPDGFFSFGIKETGTGVWGTWEFNVGKITVKNARVGDDALHDPFYRTLGQVFDIKYTVISQNKLIFEFPNNKVLYVKRSNDLWQ
jgi:hypothetical protein